MHLSLFSQLMDQGARLLLAVGAGEAAPMATRPARTLVVMSMACSVVVLMVADVDACSFVVQLSGNVAEGEEG